MKNELAKVPGTFKLQTKEHEKCNRQNFRPLVENKVVHDSKHFFKVKVGFGKKKTTKCRKVLLSIEIPRTLGMSWSVAFSTF